MKSKKVTRVLEAKLEELNRFLDDLTKQTDRMWLEMESWPVEEMTAYGRTFRVRRVMNLQTDRNYDDLMREKGHLQYQIRETEFLLAPSRGRAKGTRNRQYKPLDLTIVKAKEFSKTAEGRGLTQMELAIRFSGCKTFGERMKWVTTVRLSHSHIDVTVCNAAA
jgi:hypothetical protein